MRHRQYWGCRRRPSRSRRSAKAGFSPFLIGSPTRFAAAWSLGRASTRCAALVFVFQIANVLSWTTILGVTGIGDPPMVIWGSVKNIIKPNGFLIIDVPNAANLRKRIDLLFGRTNYPPFEAYYRSSNPYRGHIREYVYGDLEKLGEFFPSSL